MAFYQQLVAQTDSVRRQMLNSIIIDRCGKGQVTRNAYCYFLTQAYHHVRHTVPLLMAAGSRLDNQHESVRAAIVEYIQEEYGQHEWILNDLRTCGGDTLAAQHNLPGRAISLMVPWLYYQIEHHNPMAVFGMIHVLEGTSVSIGTAIARQLKRHLELPDSAFSYLNSHGELDKSHVEFFIRLMDEVTQPQDQAAIIHAAQMVYQLYAEMLAEVAGVY